MMDAREWCTRLRNGERVVHENTECCTRGARVRVVHEMGAREYIVVHEYGVVHEKCTSTSGARERVVHEIGA